MYGRLDYDDGRAVYDIEFWTATAEYDYEIDAVSGEILSMDQDAENYTPRRKPERQAPPANGSARTPPAWLRWPTPAWPDDGSVQFVHTELDRGRRPHPVYEVEFWTGSSEYDYEIDAVTGEVLHYDYDAEYHQASAGSGSTISADDAKARRLCPRRRGRGRRYPG